MSLVRIETVVGVSLKMGRTEGTGPKARERWDAERGGGACSERGVSRNQGCEGLLALGPRSVH